MSLVLLLEGSGGVDGLDAVIVKHSINISGIDGIALTKLDVLDTFKEIKICTGYRLKVKRD